MAVARGVAAVASPHHLASAAGLEVLRAGGNAMDAAVATNLMLGVVAPYLCGFGGDLFALVWTGQASAYNGSGRAPAAATPPAMRAAAGAARLPDLGPLTVTVPGAVEAWFALLDRFGSRSFATLASPALAAATDGFAVSDAAGAVFARARERYRDEPVWQAVYADAAPGARLRLPDLARTIDLLGRDGPEAFYRGPIGAAMVEHLRARGALLDAADLAEHAGTWVEPMRARFRDVEILELPPNTQGVTALEALRIADGFPPADGPGRDHLVIEAMKLALADRDAYVTDPSAMTVPAVRLIDDAWIEGRRAQIDPARASALPGGTPAAGGTAYLCAADADGMIVSLIQSNWMGFGSGVTVPGWGVNLHNRGQFFSLREGDANVIAPRKRTMHTLIPALALRDGAPWLAFGSMGGDGQAQTHLQVLTRILDEAMPIDAAIDAPRWVVSPRDWSLHAEERFGAGWADQMRARGHTVTMIGPYDSLLGHAHAIEVTPDGYAAASDPRSEGAAVADAAARPGRP